MAPPLPPSAHPNSPAQPPASTPTPARPAGIYDQAATENLAATLARLLRPGDAVLLNGPLGAGKTTFARALLRSVCADPAMDVPSPSYTLVQTYKADTLVLHHFDLWRLDGPAALDELGWEAALDDVVLVEWPDRLGLLRPPSALELTFMLHTERTRQIGMTGWDGRLEEAVLF